jgi:transposase
MHVRTSRVRRNGKTYEYAQLVETFRRESDGMPIHRVIATLGHPQDATVENLRQALTAARRGQRLVVAKQAAVPKVRASKPTANLRYLDVAVLLELWQQWGLSELLDELLGTGREQVRLASVVAALAIQRCVEPGSKLYATRWLPETALVELLGIASSSFHNTRLHRVLDQLDNATVALMAKLPARYQQRDGVFASLFMDVTDTWFVGHGCSLAERGKTKLGNVERKIGIVLLCNELGYPLRWEVVSGTQHDSKTMTRMMESVAGLSWIGEAPIVCDRAMGKTDQIREMLATGLRFVTALTETEFDSYAQQLPHASFSELCPRGDSNRDQEVEQATKCAQAAGMHKLADDLFVMDFGVLERDQASTPLSVDDDEVVANSASDVTVEAMQLCRQLQEAVAQGRYTSYAAAGRKLGLGSGLTAKYRRLHRLSEQQQCDVLDGKLVGVTLDELLRVARLASEDERQQAFQTLASSSGPSRRARERTRRRAASKESSQAPIRVRVAAYFNPGLFVDQRARAQEQLAKLQTWTAELNHRLASPRSKLTERGITAVIDRRLREASLLDAFKVRLTQTTSAGRVRFEVELVLDPAQWARRRRYDGFTVLVAHPELPHSGAELCRLYRQKDTVEKDFQVIKSVVELRPIRHHTEPKVRAHVTLCMLSLLLERTLRQRLRNSSFTTGAALEVLATCDLNLYGGKAASPSAYTITEPNQDQRAILRALRLQHLADDDHLAARITPR